MTKERELLTGVLAETLKMPQAEIDSLYESDELVDGAKDKIATAYANHIQSVKGSVQTDKKAVEEAERNGYSRGMKEALSNHEKKIKTEYGLDSSKQGLELIAELINSKANSDETLKQKLSLSESVINDLRSEVEKSNNAFTEYKQKAEMEREMAEKSGVIKSEALSHFNKSNPILPKDASKAEVWKNDYLNDFRGYGYEEVAGQKMVTKDGVVLKDNYEHPIPLNNFIQQRFDARFEVEGNSAPLPPEAKPTVTPKGLEVKSEEDYQQLRTKIKGDQSLTPEDRSKALVELAEAFRKFRENN